MSTNKNIFKDYKNPVFLETGSLNGDSIQFAIESGFENIYSIELSDLYYNKCVNRFKGIDKVHLILGDSCEKLNTVIEQINCNITFWLDGHYSCGDTALGKYWSPLIQELEQIKKHHIKTHTIIIDDMQFWIDDYKEKHHFTKDDIIKVIYEINPNYNISYIDGIVEKDILVCIAKL
jgi:hypothetical protein